MQFPRFWPSALIVLISSDDVIAEGIDLSESQSGLKMGFQIGEISFRIP